MIEEKYGSEIILNLREFKVFNKEGLWKVICLSVVRNKEVLEMVIEGVRKRVRNGRNFLFWEDIWLMDGFLKFFFSRLYVIFFDKEIKIVSMGLWEGLEWRWCF